jgi:hypothetical protein
MISSAYRFIYLHVPKTGGNSIQTLLQPSSDDKIILQGNQDGRDRFAIKGSVTPHKHAVLADYAAVLGEEIGNYKVVISVRHPFERAVSFYFSPHRWLTRKEGSDEWGMNDPYWRLDAFEACLDKMVPMVDFITLEDRLVAPDHVIRFEHLALDFNQCAADLGLQTAGLPHVNQSASTALAKKALADPEARALCADHFAADYRFFGYPAG